jgi:hypothetical protein
MRVSRHRLLRRLILDYRKLGPSAPFALGQQVIEVVLSQDGTAAVIGAIDAAPSRPPQPALDRHLLPVIGLDALRDDVKILVGRVLRQVVEFLGGRHLRKGVPVTVTSTFANGAIYIFGDAERGAFGSDDRRAWAQRFLEALQREVDGDQPFAKSGCLAGTLADLPEDDLDFLAIVDQRNTP